MKIAVYCSCRGIAPDITVCQGSEVDEEQLISMGAKCSGCRDVTPDLDLSQIAVAPGTYPYRVICSGSNIADGHITIEPPCEISWQDFSVGQDEEVNEEKILENGHVTCSCDSMPEISDIAETEDGNGYSYRIECTSSNGCSATAQGHVTIEALMPLGASCTLDSQCASGWCKSWACSSHCANDIECPAEVPYCYTGGCAASCVQDVQCDSFRPKCMDDQCKADLLSDGSYCYLDEQCASGWCKSWACSSHCANDIECPAEVPYCYTGGCAASCVQDIQCDPNRPVCNGGVCETCINNDQCLSRDPSLPVCQDGGCVAAKQTPVNC